MDNTLFWVNDEDKKFSIVHVVEEDGENTIVKPTPNSLFTSDDTWKVDKDDLYNGTEEMGDLVNLRYFSHNAITNALNWRYQKDVIYTQCGLFIVALNPFKDVNTICPEEYSKVNEEQKVPHIYEIVQNAYVSVMKCSVDQSVIISGISGSGKTETTKLAINYLCTIGKSNNDLEAKINDAGLILECFGNAETIHNHNSSRFAKFTNLYLDSEGKVAGAVITTHMLEKSRLSHVPLREKNYHVFYSLCCDASESLRAKYKLLDVHEFKVLNSENTKVASRFSLSDLKSRLTNLGFTDTIQDNIFTTIAAILHLGNIEFKEFDNNSTDLENMATLEIVSELLGVSTESLRDTLISVNVKGIVVPLTKMQAELARDSLIQNTYEKLFNFVVEVINQQFGDTYDLLDLGYVGFLDLSGYESLDDNGLEQLTINHTNDVLQQLFNELIYKEQQLYKDELGWNPVEFDLDLKNQIALINDKREGFFKVLNDVCYRQDARASDFISELELVLGDNKYFKVVDTEQSLASIEHAPNNVVYNLDTFLVKNRNLLPSSMEILLQSSKLEFVRTLFEKSTCSKSSVASFHLEELQKLVEGIEDTDYAFIKCIKPNSKNCPSNFDSEFVKKQVEWSGILETLQICSAGFPVHIKFEEFVKKYDALEPNTNEDSNRDKAALLLSKFLSTSEYNIGTSNIFLAKPSHYKLERLLRNKLEDKSDWISKTKSALSWLFGRT